MSFSQKLPRAAGLVALWAFVSLACLAIYVLGSSPWKELAFNPAKAREAARILRMMETLEEGYVDPAAATPSRLGTGALHGMAQSLDPYTVYFTGKELDQFNQDNGETCVGVGLMTLDVDDGIAVLDVQPGTSAAKLGILPGDRFRKVAGKDASTLDGDHLHELLNGAPGSSVDVELERPGGKIVSGPLCRGEMEVCTVIARGPGADGMARIQITEFTERTARQLHAALKKATAAKAKALVLDLRGNPGGCFEAALECASLFVEKDRPLLELSGRPGSKPTIYRSQPPPKGPAWTAPVAVLVDGDSASASEVLSAALHDNGAALLVGSRTFGKGCMQEIRQLPGGDGLKITIARFRSPKGIRIDGVGLEPDIVVEPDSEHMDRQWTSYWAWRFAEGEFQGLFGIEPAPDAVWDKAREALVAKLDSRTPPATAATDAKPAAHPVPARASAKP